jgi:arginase
VTIDLLVVPFDSGHHDRRMGAGPGALVRRGLVERLRAESHEVAVVEIEPPPHSWPAEIGTAFALTREIAGQVSTSRSNRRFPLILSGNCAPAAWGAVAGLDGDVSVCWFDAHGDFNTPETTITGFLDGMALSTLTGRCWAAMMRHVPGFRPVDDRSILLVGARDLDPLEERALSDSTVVCLPNSEVGSRLPDAARLVSERASSLYLHVDLDVLDPMDATANAFRSPGGLRTVDLASALAVVAATRRVQAASFTAYDPAYDTNGRAAEIATDLIAALARHL